MHIRVGTVDGEIHVSDSWTKEEVESQILEANYKIGNGDFSEVVVENYDDAMAFLMRIMTVSIEDTKTGSISLIINGVSQEFKSREIGWWRVVD